VFRENEGEIKGGSAFFFEIRNLLKGSVILDFCKFGMVRVDDRYDPISLPGFFQEYFCNTREAFLTYVFARRSLHAELMS
jgi:hypothetical protein